MYCHDYLQTKSDADYSIALKLQLETIIAQNKQCMAGVGTGLEEGAPPSRCPNLDR